MPLQYGLALAVPVLAAVALIAILVQMYGIPEPFVHDEFAYLLGADTFLEGRITNPMPPLSEFFESFHVSMRPTYHSKYPPGQSCFLALGTWGFGKPIFGVWLSYILSVLAVTWGLFAVMPPSWAALGGIFSVLNTLMLTKWAFSYWGGSVAMLGGALFLGGLLRVISSPRVPTALVMGLGLVIMSFTRPLEGLLTAVICLVPYLVFCIGRIRLDYDDRGYRRILIVLVITGGIVLVGNLFYNRALTGSFFTFPHSHWKPSVSTHLLIQQYTGSAKLSTEFKIQRLFSEFIGPILWVFLGVVLVKCRNLKYWVGLMAILGVTGYSVCTGKAWPHYVAPVVPIVMGLLAKGGQLLFQWRIGANRVGPIILCMVVLIFIWQESLSLSEQAPTTIDFKGAVKRGIYFKGTIEDVVSAQPGKHLIMVHYLEGHDPNWEYVYNRADIPSAEIIWARKMDSESNRELFKTYSGRQIWYLELGRMPKRLIYWEDYLHGKTEP